MANERKAISKKLRFEVFKRDGFVCQYCGAHPPKVILHVDHINPVAEGGKNNIDNLVTACEPCNLGKGARLLSSVPASLTEKTKQLEEMEAQIAGYQKMVLQKHERLETEKWMVAQVLFPSTIDEGCRKDWLVSISAFIDKLGFFEVRSSAEIANARFGYSKQKCFSYFCGICWNKIREGK